MRTYIFGSSHVTRLSKIVDNAQNWRLSDHEVKVRGVNEGKISSLYQYLVEVNMYKPHLVFLQIGSNDISNVEITVENILLSFELLSEILQFWC